VGGGSGISEQVVKEAIKRWTRGYDWGGKGGKENMGGDGKGRKGK